MDTKTIIQNLGLSSHEAAIYLALVTVPSASVSTLERNTELFRPQIYAALTALENKSLVHTVSKGKRKQYVAAPPKQLESIFSDLESAFYTNIDTLQEQYQTTQENRPIVSFSEGADALRAAHMDIVHTLNKDEAYYRYMPVETPLRKKYIPRGYRELRDKKGLERLIITSETTKKGSNKLTRSVRAIPSKHDLFKHNVGLTIYGDKVALADYESESVVTIKHKKFAEFQRKVFELLFSKLDKVS